MSKKGRFLEDDPTPRNLKKAGLGKLKIRGFSGLIGNILPRKFTIEVPDKSDVTWREEGRKQRKVKKVITYKQGTVLGGPERLAVIQSIMKSGDPNSGNDFNILALELMKEMPSLGFVTTMFRKDENRYNTIARAVRGLKFIDTWKNIFPKRYLSDSFVKRNITSVMMYLLGTATHPLSIEKPIYSMSGHPITIDYLSLRDQLLGRTGWTLDIAKKQFIPRLEESVIASPEQVWEDLRKKGIKKFPWNEEEFVKVWKKMNFVDPGSIPEPSDEVAYPDENRPKVTRKVEEEEEGELEEFKEFIMEPKEEVIEIGEEGAITTFNEKEKKFLRGLVEKKKMSDLDKKVIRSAVREGVSEKGKERLKEVLERVTK